MTKNFNFRGSDTHVVFGCGRIAEVGQWVEELGCKSALVLSTPNQEMDARKLVEKLETLAVDLFADATMHTPVEVTEKAMELVQSSKADCIVSFGGGSTTGLGKAIAYRTNMPQIAIPTTYAGSEATPILGQTEAGKKTTLRDRRVLPEVIIYDPELTVDLQTSLSIASGLNAMAHAAEALYAQDRNPVSKLMAIAGLLAFKTALPVIVRKPKDLEARSEALYGSWLCGSVLGTVGMALHHKICHTLGGSFDTPHAETHAIMLPYTMSFNAKAAKEELQPLAGLFGGSPGGGIYDFNNVIGAPVSLQKLGLEKSDLDQVAEIATENPYWNPEPVNRDKIRKLLQDAWDGKRPEN